MPKVGSKKNMGYGNKIAYAGHNALKDHMKGKGTIATHSQRFKYAASYFKSIGVNDVATLKREHVQQFANHLNEKVQNGELSVSYAKNILSSTNKTLETMRGDRTLRIRPSEYIGQRSQIRASPVQTARMAIERAAQRLEARGQERQAVTARCARDFGLRLREAARLDYRRALHEARTHGQINVVEGTKGNRGEYQSRWVPVSREGLKTLKQGAMLQGTRNNIMENRETYRDFARSMRDARRELKAEGVGRIHDLRSAYACARYEELTASRAPVNRDLGDRAPDRQTDRAARQELTKELGHGREDVVASYVGGKG